MSFLERRDFFFLILTSAINYTSFLWGFFFRQNGITITWWIIALAVPDSPERSRTETIIPREEGNGILSLSCTVTLKNDATPVYLYGHFMTVHPRNGDYKRICEATDQDMLGPLQNLNPDPFHVQRNIISCHYSSLCSCFLMFNIVVQNRLPPLPASPHLAKIFVTVSKSIDGVHGDMYVPKPVNQTKFRVCPP